MLPSMAETLGPLYSCKRGVLWRWWRNLTSKVSKLLLQVLSWNFWIHPCMITMLQVGWPKNSGSAPSKCTMFCLVHSVHTGSGELSASYSVGTGISFLRCKTQSVCEADNLPPYHLKVKEVWSHPFNLHMPPQCVPGQLHAHLYILNKGKVFPITCHEGREEE